MYSKNLPIVSEVLLIFWFFCLIDLSSSLLFQKSDNVGMWRFSFSFSFLPDCLELAAINPANFDSAGDIIGRMNFDVKLVSIAFLNSFLEPLGCSTISSWTTIFNVDLLWHLKIYEFYQIQKLNIRTQKIIKINLFISFILSTFSILKNHILDNIYSHFLHQKYLFDLSSRINCIG